MIRTSSIRLFALIFGVAVVMSCDAGNPTGIGGIDPGTDPGTGGGNPAVGGDGRQPTVIIDTAYAIAPHVARTTFNVGDSVFVAVRVRDASGIRSVQVAGLTVSGDSTLGTDRIDNRYVSVSIPQSGSLPAGTGVSETTLLRYLKPATPVDSTPGTLVVRAIAVDNSGISDTAYQAVSLVSGPRIQVLEPSAGDSVFPGTRVNVRYRIVHTRQIASSTVRIRSDARWPTPIDSTVPRGTYPAGTLDTVETTSFMIPANAPATPRSQVTITVDASDVNGVPGAPAAVVIGIQSSEPAIPTVRQTVPARAELGDTVHLVADGGAGISRVGYIVRSSDGTGPALYSKDSIFDGSSAKVPVSLPLSLPPTFQGRTVSITGFAVDRRDSIGYAIPATSSIPVSTLERAQRDTVLMVHGRTFALPPSRNGAAGDLAVDPVRGHVFVSNPQFNRVEVWQAATSRFHATGVSVGAEPWGMTIGANNADELLVANSGGTNISRVNIASNDVASISERSRILTRNTVAYSVTETRDEKTGKIRIVVTGPISYSDRPQYIAQSAGGRIYYSTRPTSSAPAGTLRYLDPAHPYPDSRQIWQYGSGTPTLGQTAILNADMVSVRAAKADSPASDSLTVCDHPTGTLDPATCVMSDQGVGATMALLQATVPTTDAVAVPVDIPSLALTDTTFVAWSADRNWLAFGEGNTSLGARVMLTKDSAGTPPGNIFFSPALDVSDLVENAAEQVFGLALDSVGRALAVHGTKTYFGAVEQPFHLRMQGQFDTFDAGAGVAFHPQAKVDPKEGGVRDDPTRVAFVASENGEIEIVDAYYFVSRGRVAVRNKLYGPLRAVLPTAEEAAADVAVKLYGLTELGLVEIKVTRQEIKPVP